MKGKMALNVIVMFLTESCESSDTVMSPAFCPDPAYWGAPRGLVGCVNDE